MRRVQFVAAATFISLCAFAANEVEVDFNRDVRPILSENCFTCHGPDKDKRKSALRLDTKEGAYGTGKSGATAIVPGDLAKSELIKRISTKDEDEIMPPPGEHKKLSVEQLSILTRWIAKGAPYDKHWAFKPVQTPALPAVKNAAWPKNEIDRFILARLEKAGIKPSLEEDKVRLMRRVTLDLTGLPPSIADVDAFVNDAAPDAYSKLVDRLLASPHFGERMAVPWLDLARYADTAGYHNDSLRDMWLWRDWVVKSFNQNKPFSDFTIEQIAGDMMPGSTVDQKIATGFHRNVMTSDEGGIIPDEYLNLYVVDRVNTTGITWMGMTIGCSQCHDHKYDPTSQKEYYQMYSFFHNVPESGIDGVRDRNPKPFMFVPSPEQQAKLDQLAKDVKEAEAKVAELNKGFDPAFKTWLAEEPKKPAPTDKIQAGLVGHFSFDSVSEGVDHDGKPIEAKLTGDSAKIFPEGRIGGALSFDTKAHFNVGNVFAFEKDKSFSAGAWVKLKNSGTGHLFGKLEKEPRFRGWRIEMTDRRVNVQIISSWDKDALEVRSKDQIAQDKWQHIVMTYDGSSKAEGIKIFINGKPVAVDIKKKTLKETIVSADAPFSIGGPQNGNLEASVDDLRIYDRALAAADTDMLVVLGARALLDIPDEKRTPAQKEDLKTAFRNSVYTALGEAEKRVADLKKERSDYERTVPNTMVMEEMPKPRETMIRIRGAYDKKGDKVDPGVPAFLAPLAAPVNGKTHTRLDFAKWLVSPEQTLTHRVTINRFWAALFGTGLVKTVNDFGMQGEWPSHPELLDWLAADFMRDWNIKRAIKQIVTSATYRQSSRVTKELLEKDSENRLLARGPRSRLDAEFIRDNALSIAGLLNLEMGGKGVMPAQPPGIWEVNDMANGAYKKTTGIAQYRRGLYIYWRRSTPYPSFLTFDMPQREFCAAVRARTSTPLQSLVLMNDPVYVEAARAFAQRTLKEGGADSASRLAFMWRAAMSRQPAKDELSVLEKTLAQQLENYKKDKKAAESLTKIGDLANPAGIDISELAAWTAVANVILNLNETISK